MTGTERRALRHIARAECLSVEQLPAAVIVCALDDAGLLPPDPRSLKPGLKPLRRQKAKQTALNRVEPVLFLTDPSRPWATAREAWASFAGIDPEVLRKKVIGLLAAARTARFAQVRTRTRVHASGGSAHSAPSMLPKADPLCGMVPGAA
jgi:hypothetical protein